MKEKGLIGPLHVLYRYERGTQWETDEFGNRKVIFRILRILRRTRTGVWVDSWGKEKFIPLDYPNFPFGKWACTTRAAARKGFRIRALNCRSYAQAALDLAEHFVALTEGWEG